METERPNKRRLTYVTYVLIIFGLLIGVHAIIENQYEDRGKRPRGSQALHDMRVIGIGIESYYVENSAYPAHAVGKDGLNGGIVSPQDPAFNVPTFAIKSPARPGLNTLTTPTQYMDRDLPVDQFGNTKGTFYAYWVGGKYGQGWILYSPGPDKKYDIVPWEDYDPAQKRPSDSLINKTFDPTNGVNSKGDIYCYKQ